LILKEHCKDKHFYSFTSRPQRVVEIAERYGLNGDEVLDNILLARAYTHEQQMDIITAAAAKIVEDDSPYHLLVGITSYLLDRLSTPLQLYFELTTVVEEN
jgi:singapore isolate B (sub-type 7) whole genome shotgun sequence assembly, scaffold_11